MKTQHAAADMRLDCNAGQTLLTQKIMSLYMHCLCMSRYCFCLFLPNVCCAAVLLDMQRSDCGASVDSAIFVLDLDQLHMPLIRRRDSSLKHILHSAGAAGVPVTYMQVCVSAVCKDLLP